MESTQIMSAEDTQAVANNAEDRAYLKDLHGAELPGQYGEYHHDIGSAAGDPQNAFVTPFDVKWDYLINYDHDFISKKALLEIRKAPPRTASHLRLRRHPRRHRLHRPPRRTAGHRSAPTVDVSTPKKAPLTGELSAKLTERSQHAAAKN